MQGKPRERCPLQPSEPPSSAPRSRSLRRQSRRRRSVRRDKRRDDSAFAEPSPSAGLARQNNVGSVTNREVRPPSVPKDAIKDDVEGEDEFKDEMKAEIPSPGAKIESPNIAEEMQGKRRERCRLQPSEPPSSAPMSRSPRRQSRRRRSVRRGQCVGVGFVVGGGLLGRSPSYLPRVVLDFQDNAKAFRRVRHPHPGERLRETCALRREGREERKT